MISVFLLVYVKVVLAPYPILLDQQLFLFALIALNFRFFIKYVEGIMILAIIAIFSVFSTIFMWITWLDRFSGNANFFYF